LNNRPKGALSNHFISAVQGARRTNSNQTHSVAAASAMNYLVAGATAAR
jgi:hypothetical protein